MTIGAISGADVKPGLKIDLEAANRLLEADLQSFEAGVAKLVKAPVTSNQFSAVVCFAYNVGLGNLKQSTLLRCLNKGNYYDAAQEFLRWNKGGGKIVAGLDRRRKAERELFLAEA